MSWMAGEHRKHSEWNGEEAGEEVGNRQREYVRVGNRLQRAVSEHELLSVQRKYY